MTDDAKGAARGPTPVEPEIADTRVLELLVCPITKAPLVYDKARQLLISRNAHLAYPIRRGVPHMVPSEAIPTDKDPGASSR